MKRLARISAVGILTLALSCCAKSQPSPESIAPAVENRAVALLVTQAQSSDPAVRANCIEALQLVPDPRALELIEAGVHDDQWVVRFAAAMAAGKRKASIVRPVLNTLVKTDPSGSVRSACVYALRRLGDSSHMTDLARALSSDDPSTRANTAFILGMLGDASAIPLLDSRREEPDIRVRFEITAALARLGDKSAQEVIVSWAVSRFAEDEWNAMAVCADLPPSVASSPLLLGLQDIPANLPPQLTPKEVRDLTTRRQLVAARSLAKLNNAMGAQVAIANLTNENPNLRGLAVLALGDILDGSQVPNIVMMLNDPDESVRRAVAAAILNIYLRSSQG